MAAVSPPWTCPAAPAQKTTAEPEPEAGTPRPAGRGVFLRRQSGFPREGLHVERERLLDLGRLFHAFPSSPGPHDPRRIDDSGLARGCSSRCIETGNHAPSVRIHRASHLVERLE